MSIKDLHLAIVGATGAVGREVIQILQERNLSPKSIKLGASARSAGETIEFFDDSIIVEEVTDDFFDGVDVAIASAGSAVSKTFFSSDNRKNSIIVDNCSYFRMDPEVPLVIPEINPFELENRPPKSIIANPNCTTIGMLTVLGAIHQLLPLKKIICSSYQSVSGAGQKGMDELSSQIQSAFNMTELKKEVFPQNIAFNAIPNIGGFLPNLNTTEEQKMVDETHKILGDDQIQVFATCVRIPTFIGHGLSVYVETQDKVDIFEVREILSCAKGVMLLDAPDRAVYPVLTDCQGRDDVYVGRVRQGVTDNSFSAWIVSDNLRKGAALNAVQIVEEIAKKSWIKS